MKTKEALAHFEQAVEIAQANNEQATEQISRGLIALVASLNTELRMIRNQLDTIQKQTR